MANFAEYLKEIEEGHYIPTNVVTIDKDNKNEKL